VLHSHGGALVDQSAEALGMNARRSLGADPETAHIFELI
jgi:hypothetical protein